MRFCHAILALIWKVLRLGVTSLNILPSTGIASTIGEGKGIGLETALGLPLEMLHSYCM